MSKDIRDIKELLALCKSTDGILSITLKKEEVEILLDYINKLEESIKDITEKDYNQLKNENNFLSKRENKLQLIEQMFQSGVVDLSKLSKIVEDKC